MAGQWQRSRWGRTTFGQGRYPAMAVAIPLGAVLAVGVGFLTFLSGLADGPHPVLVATSFAVVMYGTLVALAWAVVVDSATLRGAVDRPDDSIESVWLERACAGAFRDTLVVTGLGLAIIALADFDPDAELVLGGVIVVAFASLTTRYVVAKQQG